MEEPGWNLAGTWVEPGWNLGGVEVGVFHEGVKKGDTEEWRRGGGEVE